MGRTPHLNRGRADASSSAALAGIVERIPDGAVVLLDGLVASPAPEVLKLAVKYARLAREAVLIEYGEGTGDAEGMRVLAEAPKEHFSWRARVGR